MKPIIVTNNLIDKLCEQLRTKMLGMPATGNTVSISVPTKLSITKDEMPTVMVSDTADRKMRALVQQCNEEIAWHGTVDYDHETNTYTIDDIFVFPQEVTGVTAVSKDGDYEQWLMELPNEVFSRLRFHGHSHVNMGVTPSITDTTYQDTLLSMVDDFYLFAIINKRDDYNIWVYNKQMNIMYEKEDINYDAEVAQLAAWVHTEMTAKVSKRAAVIGYTTVLDKPIGWKPTWADGYTWDDKSKGYVPKSTLEKKIKSGAATVTNMPNEKKKPGRKPKAKVDTYKDYQQQVVKNIDNRRASLVCEGNCIDCRIERCMYK